MIFIKCRTVIPLTESAFLVRGVDHIFFFHEQCVGEQFYTHLPPLEGPNAYRGLLVDDPQKDFWPKFPDVSTR